MSGYLRLKVAELLREKKTNLHQAHLEAGFSYPTMHRYQRYPDQIASLHTPSIVALLVDALGWSPAEIEAMPFGHFFEVVTDGDHEPLDRLAMAERLIDENLVHLARLNDKVLDRLIDEISDRVAYLLERQDRPPPTAEEERRYLLDLLHHRLTRWPGLAAILVHEDDLIDLVQAVALRLEELKREAGEE